MQYELQKRRSREYYHIKKAARAIGFGEKNRMAVEAYNEAVRARAAERKAGPQAKRKLLLPDEQSRSRTIAELSGWIEKQGDGWHATARVDGKPKLLGIFKSLGEAARAQRDFDAT